tara:strand:+ start:3009 stop:4373 length:1365 start_codon:yes stop_codon:yes gene_type:complete
MATHDIFMPALSSTMTEGKIVEWLKKPGDKVKRGESVLVVESDKADMDVESFHDGYLAVILTADGSSAPVGETIGLIVESESEIQKVQKETPSTPLETSKEKSSKEEVALSDQDVTAAIPQEKQVPSFETPSAIPLPRKNINKGRIIASPRAKKLASQRGVDLSQIMGSGPHGRIQADDVLRAKGEPISVPWVAESNFPVSLVDNKKTSEVTKDKSRKDQDMAGKSFGSPGEEVTFNTLQQAVNRNMESSLSIPCFRVGYTIETERFDSIYKDIKSNGVTMTAMLAKAVGLTLARHLQVNAAWNAKGMTYPQQINVAVAVAMEDGGLITPVLQNANKTDIFDLSKQWKDLVKRARSKQLQPNEYSSGTFTLSNLGMFGVDRFDAILPPGTGAILAVAASLPKVVAGQDGSISVKKQMQVNLTADHRVVYGADGAAFLRDLASLIEDHPEDILKK